jgi:hypothetical protein
MKSSLLLPFILFILFIIIFYYIYMIHNEGFFDNSGALIQLSSEAFGMSPGVIDQLNSTRVISQREYDIDKHLYDNLTRQGIINMTES